MAGGCACAYGAEKNVLSAKPDSSEFRSLCDTLSSLTRKTVDATSAALNTATTTTVATTATTDGDDGGDGRARLMALRRLARAIPTARSEAPAAARSSSSSTSVAATASAGFTDSGIDQLALVLGHGLGREPAEPHLLRLAQLPAR